MTTYRPSPAISLVSVSLAWEKVWFRAENSGIRVYWNNYIQKFLHSDWQRACQLIQTVQELEFFLVQKDEISGKSWVKNDWQVPWKTVTKAQNGGQVRWEQQHFNSKFDG